MNSQAFIKHAGNLSTTIRESRNAIGTADELRVRREAIQKEINQLFAGLQNPTLPSAYRLRDAALRNGFTVDPRVQHRLTQFENV